VEYYLKGLKNKFRIVLQLVLQYIIAPKVSIVRYNLIIVAQIICKCFLINLFSLVELGSVVQMHFIGQF
jgi:hypothetical protein